MTEQAQPAPSSRRPQPQVVKRSLRDFPSPLDADGMIQAVKNLPIVACSLSAFGQRERLGAWRSLLDRSQMRERLSTGMRYRFSAELANEARALAAAEEECCSFLRFNVEQSGDSVLLTVESDGEGLDALRFIFA
jgi:hypothetical protein